MQYNMQDQIKEQLGKEAAALVEEGMLIGLGTGSTAKCFIASLIQRCKEGLKITAVSSSERSKKQAEAGGIPLADIQEVSEIDLTIDGADEVDPKLRLIKGGGGAHVREKILASASKRLLILADETKLVKKLGQRVLPVEIVPFGIKTTLTKIEALGYTGELRKEEKGALYITDNQNYLFDIKEKNGFSEPEKLHQELIQIPAVIDTGFFFDLADEVMVGYQDGHIERIKR